MIRVVLDTNVLVSALVFEGGRLAWIRQSWQSWQSWQSGRVKPVLAEPIARELLRMLAYPKFQLKRAEIEQFLAELLPWSETWRQPLEPSQLRNGHGQDLHPRSVSSPGCRTRKGSACRPRPAWIRFHSLASTNAAAVPMMATPWLLTSALP